MKLVNQLVLSVVTLILPGILFAHEGMHATGQAHVGESHMGLMEVSLAVLALLAVGAWFLKEAKK